MHSRAHTLSHTHTQSHTVTHTHTHHADEFTCIGCRNCNNVCPKTFGIEEEYGEERPLVLWSSVNGREAMHVLWS